MVNFTKEAMKRWNEIPRDIQNKLLSNVYCSQCLGMTTIEDFNGKIVTGGDLVLQGVCCICKHKVARLIEVG